MIVASIRAATAPEAISAIERARAAGAQAAELRADYLERPEIAPIVKDNALPLILCVRPAWEGGRWTGSEVDRAFLLREGAQLGCAYVDIEFRAYKDVGMPMSQVIVSLHDFVGIPDGLEKLVAKMAAMEPFAAKVAVTPRTAEELAYLVDLQRSWRAPVTVVAMGEFGQPTRIAYRSWGGVVTYGSMGEGEETAPGQVPVRELVDLYDAAARSEATRLFAVIGDPVAHSKSPEWHNPRFRARRVDAMLFRLRLDRGEALRGVIERLGLAGAAVTIPHKERAAEVADVRDGDVERTGAANTLVRRGDGWHAHNTDVAAVRECLRGKARGRALVLGAGGAARAAAAALVDLGCAVTMAGRSREKALAAAHRVGVEVAAWEERARAAADVIVNATPLGMAGELAIPAGALRRGQVVLDAVYTPVETPLVAAARRAGAEVVLGTEMFERQAAAQFELFVEAG